MAEMILSFSGAFQYKRSSRCKYMPLQHMEAQFQPATHSCNNFRCSNAMRTSTRIEHWPSSYKANVLENVNFFPYKIILNYNVKKINLTWTRMSVAVLSFFRISNTIRSTVFRSRVGTSFSSSLCSCSTCFCA